MAQKKKVYKKILCGSRGIPPTNKWQDKGVDSRGMSEDQVQSPQFPP